MQCRMLHSCNLASSRVSPLEHTFSRWPSRSKLCICRASSSASQPGAQLDFGASQSLSRSSLSPGSFCKDNTNGGFRKDEAGLTTCGDRHSQEATDNLSVGQLGNAGSSVVDEEQRSERMPHQSSSEEETEAEPSDDDEEPFEPITKINVPKQKYIPISKVSLVKALADTFNDEKKATEFLTICSLLDFILHAEHKTILEKCV